MNNIKCNISKNGVMAFLSIIFALTLVQPVFAEDASPDSWEFSVAGYFWAPDITGETDGDDVIISLSDIIRTLDMTYMGSFGAKKDKLSFLTDVLYFDLQETQSSTLLQDPIFKLDLTDIELKAWIVTPMVAYEVVRKDHFDLSLMVGARYLWLEADLELREQLFAASRKYSDSFSNHAWDGIVGVRGSYEMNEQWYVPFHFDVGTGDTDLTWQAYVGLMYRTGNWEVGGGYRYLTWDFDDSDPFGKAFKKLTVEGPMVGVKYNF
jgi:hypothetical protein